MRSFMEFVGKHLFPRSVQTDEVERVVQMPMRAKATAPRKDLGPNQLKWLEDKFLYYGVYRQQALAEVGTAPTAVPNRECSC